MRPFDPQSYLADVLGPYRDSAESPSLFERYVLDLDDADDDAIERRLEEVKRYWDKQTEHPRYGSMIRDLTEKHAEAKLILADAGERARAVGEARGRERETTDRKNRDREGWERLLEQIVASAGGLDPARRAQLEKVGRRAGIPDAELRARLDAAPEVEEPDVLDPAAWSGIVANLADLARALEEPRLGLSLFHALGLDVTAEQEEVRARRDTLVAENNKGREGNVKSAWDRVLSQAKVHLLDADPGAYVNALVAHVRDELDQVALEATADDNVIDAGEAEDLRRRAIELGLSSELAEQAIAELAREHGVFVRTGEPVDLIACPACNRQHRDAGVERCGGCGAALFVPCPSCGKRAEAAASRCSGCGADLRRHATAARGLERLPELIGAGRVAQAQEELERAVAVLGSSGDGVAQASRTVQEAVEAARRAWAEVEAARADRRQYAARRLLGDLARKATDFISGSGEQPAEVLAAVEARIDEAEALMQEARGDAAGRREAVLVRVLHLAADYAEAERELDKLPPQPPTAVEARPGRGAMSVRWHGSPTAGVSYAVTRVVLPRGVESRVGETEGLQLEDAAAPGGALVRYRVTAVRGRASSPPAGSEAVVAAYEVRDLVAAAGDGQVDLSWAPIGESGRVVVERREKDAGAAVEIHPDLAGATDADVVNGRRYTYRVLAEYPSPDGGTIRTDGQTVFAQPVERPQPIAALRVRGDQARVEIEFDPPPAGSVVVFRSTREPEVTVGEALDARRLADLGTQLPTQGASAVDADPPEGRCFYLPVTSAGSMAIAGAAVGHVVLPEIENAQVVANGGRAQVTWTWPQGITIARVVWRHDRRPDGSEDPHAQSVDYRFGEYRDSGGFSLEMGEQRSLFVSVFPATRVEGGVVCGSGAGRGSRAMLRQEEKTPVRYSVRRVGGLRKRLEVEVSEPAEGNLPELVLVGREGDILPRTVADGQVLARLGGEGPRSSSLEMRELSRPLAVRLFLDSSGAAGSHVLFDPMVDDLLIG